MKNSGLTTLQLAVLGWLFVMFWSSPALAGVKARYIRVDNPTGFAMEWRQIEVLVDGKNVVLHHPEWIRGTLPPTRENVHPTETNIVLTGGRGAQDITGGDTDTSHRASEWRAFVDPVDNGLHLNPWFEVDLGRPVEIDRIVLYGSRYPTRFYLDKGHRVISALGEDRKVVWANKFQYYEKEKHAGGIFKFEPVQENIQADPEVGVHLPVDASDWVAMGWLLNADQATPPPDAEQRARVFADRDSDANIALLARQFFPLLDQTIPELEPAFRLYDAGKYAEALNAWKRYWFVKMARVNMHTALHGEYVSYNANGDDLMSGIMVTITPNEARALRYTPGQIRWIDLPTDPAKDPKALSAAMEDGERKAQVGKTCWPLLYAYRRAPDPKYLIRWSEVMDDWALNYFADAALTPYEVENLFTFSPAHSWGTMMEDLSDIAREHPEMVEHISAITLARVQILCMEKYGSAWWRQVRETVFNHNTGGLYSWGLVIPYLGEFYPGQRLAREWRQGLERFMTLGTERDGSMTEIGDEGHMEMPVILGYTLSMLEKQRPDWYTPGWRNRATEWYDGMFEYMFRHLSPGGFEHRFAIGYRPSRWISTSKQYLLDRPLFRPLDRDAEFSAIPEVRRLLDAWGHISSGGPASADPLIKPIIDAEQKSHDAVLTLLGNQKPGPPHINSDWMPYTGAYYFRGGWNDDAPFLAMMACGSHGGSQAPQWPFGMFYHYDYDYPLIAAQPVQVDGLPPQQLFGRMNTFQPGTKTMALTNADEKPAVDRWLSDGRFDFGEATFKGGYQKYPGFKGDWNGASLEQLDAGKSVVDVRSVRQVLHLRRSRLFIVTDAVNCPDGASHDFSIPFKLSLSSRQQGASKPFGPSQLRMDEKRGQLTSDNPDGPSVAVYQFADSPVKYQCGSEAKLDFKNYSPRLGPSIGIADQPISAHTKGKGMTLISLIASRDKGEADPIVSSESQNGTKGITGFHASLRDGNEIWYESAGIDSGSLACGPARATGQALLVVKSKDGISGILLSGKDLSLNGKSVTSKGMDFEFNVAASDVGLQIETAPIDSPIDPVSFSPNRNTFSDSETVEMTSHTPGIEIRYTTDGTPPGPTSRLYTGPVKISETTEFSARAYRLGPDNKPIPSDDFEANGTKFSVPSYGWFYKRSPLPAISIDEKSLQPGLNYEFLKAPWWRLYASGHWLSPDSGGTVEREMDLSKVVSSDPYGMRYTGFLRIPADGVYTFHAPHELVYMDAATSYDLRLYIDGEEWYLTQWWHGHGTWSVPMMKGFHTFEVDFADARSTPWKKSGIWRYYPRPWAVYSGHPTDVLLSGPGMEPARIPKEWLFRKPVQH